MTNKAKTLNYLMKNRHLTMPILSFPSIQLTGITVKELVHSSELQAQGMKEIAKRCPTSVAVNMMDLSVEAEAFGAHVKFREDEPPAVISHPVKTLLDAKNLKVPKFGTKRTKIYVEAIKKAKKLIPDRLVFAGVIGPFSLAGNLMGMTDLMLNCHIEPEIVNLTVKKATQYLIEYVKEFKKSGADGIVIAEPVAGLLSPIFSYDFSAVYVNEIIAAVCDEDFICVYHNCGNTIPQAHYIKKINADIYHFGNVINLKEILEIMPEDKIIMGNIDPAAIIRNGTPELITKKVTALLKECSSHPNFIISSGCDIPPDTSWENIDAYFKAITDYFNK
ncbi:MAG: methyltransferase [Acholeplasmataceae bacterium]|jgi:uroporphyrinogen decarboxylase|nr:methyltransferase [Acholeplasmataceae bacterium]